jgi:hypothetical protein
MQQNNSKSIWQRPAILAAHVTWMMCNPFVEQMVSPISHLAMLAAQAHRELKVTIILIVHVSIQSCVTVALEKFRKNITGKSFSETLILASVKDCPCIS